jgi:hypothetical protein
MWHIIVMVAIKANRFNELSVPIHNIGIMLVDYNLKVTENKTAHFTCISRNGTA